MSRQGRQTIIHGVRPTDRPVHEWELKNARCRCRRRFRWSHGRPQGRAPARRSGHPDQSASLLRTNDDGSKKDRIDVFEPGLYVTQNTKTGEVSAGPVQYGQSRAERNGYKDNAVLGYPISVEGRLVVTSAFGAGDSRPQIACPFA